MYSVSDWTKISNHLGYKCELIERIQLLALSTSQATASAIALELMLSFMNLIRVGSFNQTLAQGQTSIVAIEVSPRFSKERRNESQCQST